MNIKIKYKKFVYLLGFSLFFVLIFSMKNNTFKVSANSGVNQSSTTTQVAETPQEIKLNVNSKSLVKEKSYNLRVYNLNEKQKVSYKSSDSELVSVDQDGMVTGKSIGTATITVTVKEGSKIITTLTCEITVGPPAISVKLTKTELIIVVGKKTTLKTILQPYNTVEEIKFSTCDEAIATVSPGGRISANTVGSTYIVAKLDNGKFDACKVSVVDEETFNKIMKEAEQNASSEDGSTATPTPTP